MRPERRSSILYTMARIRVRRHPDLPAELVGLGVAAEAEGARRTQRSRRSGMRHERRSSSLCTTAHRYASEHRHPLRAVQSVLKPPLAAVAITIRTRCSLRSRRRRKSTACTTVRTSPPSLILNVAVAVVVARSCTPSSRRNERDQPPHSSTACTNCRRPFFSPAVGFYGAVRLPPSMLEEFLDGLNFKGLLVV